MSYLKGKMHSGREKDVPQAYKDPPVTRYVPSCCALGGPEAHAANPTTQNPTTQPDAARPSQLHSALQCHRMAFEFGSLLICTQCSADTGLTCYGDCDDCIIMCGMRYALHHRVHHTLCIASLYA